MTLKSVLFDFVADTLSALTVAKKDSTTLRASTDWRATADALAEALAASSALLSPGEHAVAPKASAIDSAEVAMNTLALFFNVVS
jgi:hypothetical protein